MSRNMKVRNLKFPFLKSTLKRKRLVFSRRNVLREERAARNAAYKEERARREEERKGSHG